MRNLLMLTALVAWIPAALASDERAAPPAAATAPPTGKSAAPFRATGNEPSWRLDIGTAEMILLTNFGQDRLVAPTPKPEVSGGTTRYVARTPRGPLTATITDRPCVDSMSGMPHPKTVQVVTGGQTLNGCGGEPASLLQGREWAVVEIAGAPLVAGSKVTVAFAADGKLTGQASCNRFTGGYSLSGEGLSLSPGAVTRMACGEAVMGQERTFLAALGKVNGFSLAADGSLQLRTFDGRSIVARRP
jgi:heat shock protein HslJ